MKRVKATYDESATPEERREAFKRLENSHYELQAFGTSFEALRVAPSARILDVGFGSGAMLRELALSGRNYCLVGLETAADFTGWAKELAESEGVANIDFRQVDFMQLRGETFDVIHLGQVIFGLGKLPEVFAHLASLLSPNGIVVIQNFDLSSCRIDPSGKRFDEMILNMQSHFTQKTGHPYSASLIGPAMQEFGFEDVEVRIRGKGANLATNSSFFYTLETFLPKVEQDAAYDYIQQLGRVKNRFGFRSSFLITGCKTT